jgi:hypothetical protein
MSFSTLPDALLKDIASFLPPEDLGRFEMVDKRAYRLDFDDLWHKLCSKRWKAWPRYRMTDERLVWIRENLSNLNWKGLFVWTEEDAKRIRITWEELEALSWFFNFTPHAGGRGTATLQKCHFNQGLLFLRQYRPMPYRLEVVDGLQYLRIYHFPPHRVDRLPNAEWLITNVNVTFVSNDVNEALTYRERGFQANIADRRETAMMD